MTTIQKKNKTGTKKETNNISLTDDKMINEVLGNMGKRSKNPVKKELINNFINNKSFDDTKKAINKTTNKNVIVENDIENEKKTFTGNLTKEEINEKLQDYKLVDDISKVPLGTHMRYFVNKNGEKLFRMGGNLKRNLDLPKFVILENAVGTQWSVQVKDTTFYKKMSIKEIKEEYDGIIDELHEKIKKYKKKIEDKDHTILELQEILKKNKSKK